MGLARSRSVNPAVGETVLLEVAPDRKASGSASSAAGAASSATGATPIVLDQGMIVALEGSVEAPEGPSDSGYDQARQLLHQGIKVVFRADGVDSIAVLGRRGGVSGWFDRLRSSARAHLSLGPNARVNEVLQGVVMGDTVGIDEGWLDAFRRSGTAHMLSVSGLHVASLAAIMIGLARLLGAARWVGYLLAAASALLMIPFVGASPPIVRSAVMICVVLAGSWVGRGRDQWQVLASRRGGGSRHEPVRRVRRGLSALVCRLRGDVDSAGASPETAESSACGHRVERGRVGCGQSGDGAGGSGGLWQDVARLSAGESAGCAHAAACHRPGYGERLPGLRLVRPRCRA